MSDEDVNRRGFLRSTAITSAVALGGAAASGTATARSPSVDPETAESLLAAHAGDLLSELADRGIVTTGDPAALPTGTAVGGRNAKRTPGTAYVEHDDRPDQLVVSLAGTHTGDGVTARVVVQPDTGESVAFYEDARDDYRLATIEDGSYVSGDVGTLADCGCDCCGWLCYDCCDYDSCAKKDYICCYSGGLCDCTCGGC